MKLRCATYTRKSTEEGLDQEFNSLDAQRAACEAYVQSQAGEGWTTLKERYDDGGISGATMDRPALQQLLANIEAGKIDVGVVYKVDRLTRALSDFAKIVEIFDARNVSFVSVTQQFNTTSSMGRLTLNVLLSFAQFEREVTAERIRDKIAASKKKGMWMGGLMPLGYDAIDRKLIINEAEARTVRTLFDLYLKYGNVRLVKEDADRQGLTTKTRTPNGGQRRGGEPFTRGHIYKLLTNPIYVGEIVHKGARYPGAHEAIVNRQMWDSVQERLNRNSVARRSRSNSTNPSLLAGLIFDERGNRMVPSHASKSGRRYRYYVAGSSESGSSNASDCLRLPARAIEEVVVSGLCEFLCDRPRLISSLDLTGPRLKEVLSQATHLGIRIREFGPAEQRLILSEVVNRIDVRLDRIDLALDLSALHSKIGANQGARGNKESSARNLGEFRLDLPVTFRRRGVEMKLVINDGRNRVQFLDEKLIAAISRGHGWFAQLKGRDVRSIRDIAERDGSDQADVSRIVQLSFLAPDIVDAILEGRQPLELTASRLKRGYNLPATWTEQRRNLGFAR